MVLPTWFSIAAGLVVAIAGGMACVLFVRRKASASHRSLAVLLGATAVAHLANAAGLLDEPHALLWRATAMVAELVQPAALLYVGLAFLSPVERSQRYFRSVAGPHRRVPGLVAGWFRGDRPGL